jgi:hypothetical protein
MLLYVVEHIFHPNGSKSSILFSNFEGCCRFTCRYLTKFYLGKYDVGKGTVSRDFFLSGLFNFSSGLFIFHLPRPTPPPPPPLFPWSHFDFFENSPRYSQIKVHRLRRRH